MNDICQLCGGDHHTWSCHLCPPEVFPTLEKADRRSPFPQPALAPCGTYAAARRHRRDGLDGKKLREICPPCADAERLYLLPMQRDWRRRNFKREQERLKKYNPGRQPID